MASSSSSSLFRETILSFLVVLFFVTSPSPTQGKSDKKNEIGSGKIDGIDSHLLTEKIPANRTIKVDVNGNGDFKSVQAAIDSIPEGNSGWVIVHLRKGVFRYVPTPVTSFFGLNIWASLSTSNPTLSLNYFEICVKYFFIIIYIDLKMT